MDKQLKTIPQLHNAFRASLLMLGALTLYSLIVFYLAFQTWTWQLLTHAGGMIVFGLITAVGAVVIRRGRSVLGIGLMLGGLYLAGLSATLTVADFGTTVGFIMIYLTLGVAGLTLPQKSANWAIAAGVVAGLVNLLLEFYAPLTYRLEIPILPTGALVISGILALIYLGFIARQFRNYSLRTKLIMAFVLMTLVSIGIMTFIINRVIQTELTEAVGANLKGVANSQADVIGDLLATQVDTLTAQGARKSVIDKVKLNNESYTGDSAAIQAEIDRLDQQWQDADAANNDADPLVQSRLNSLLAVELRSLRDLAPDHVEIFVTDQYGAIVAATNRTSDYYQADEEWWQAAFNNGQGAVYIGQPKFDESSRTYAVIIALPLYDGTPGTAVGVLRSTFNITALTNVLSAAQFGQTTDVALLLPGGELIKRTGDIVPVDPNALAQLQASKEATYAQFILEGKPKLVSQAPLTTHHPEKQQIIAKLGWQLIVDQDPAEALLPVNTTVQTGLLSGLGVVLLAGLLAIGVAQILAGPITRLTAVATQIAAGDLTAQAPVGSADEIGRLAQAFNDMTSQLRELIDSLEERVTSRTERLELVATLSEHLIAILELETLLQELVNQIKDKFGYYHVHVYLADDANSNLIMTAGVGEAGAQMKAEGHSISLNAPTSLVARAARAGEIIRVDNVREAADWLPNPLLPNTYSEMAVPIIFGKKVVGVLDVQQDKVAGLDEGDVNLLRTLANQVAVAIHNAYQFAEIESALAEAREVQSRYMEQAWEQAKKTQQAAYHYQRSGVLPLSETIIVQLEHQVMAENQPTIIEVKDKDDERRGTKVEPGDESLTSPTSELQTPEIQSQTALIAPIRWQDQIIGTLQLHDTERPRHWSERELALVEAITEQIAQTAENIRLFEETRERASREQTIREITDKLRVAPNLDALLETAARELGQRLGVRHTVLELGINSLSTPSPSSEHLPGNGRDSS